MATQHKWKKAPCYVRCYTHGDYQILRTDGIACRGFGVCNQDGRYIVTTPSGLGFGVRCKRLRDAKAITELVIEMSSPAAIAWMLDPTHTGKESFPVELSGEFSQIARAVRHLSREVA